MKAAKKEKALVTGGVRFMTESQPWCLNKNIKFKKLKTKLTSISIYV